MPENPINRLRFTITQFASIPEADWNLLEPYIELRSMKKQECFSSEGKRSGTVGFLLSGLFRQYYTIDGEEKTTWFFFENDLLCSYISCITGQPSLVTIEALTDAEYLCFPYAHLEQLYRTSSAWLNFGRKVAEYIATALEARMVSLLTQKPEERYRQLLKAQNSRIIEQIPQQYIANYLGITPVSLSRIRSRTAR
jgi:CRP-like cAMP-binding protein